MKRIKRVQEYMKKTPVFDTKSVSRLAGNTGYAYVLLNHLLKSGRIKRLAKGYYTTYQESSLIVYCMRPAYLGLQDAMGFHNLWEQETSPIVVTTRKVRCGVRKVLGNNVIIRRISPKYFFGFDYHKYGDVFLPVSDIEKTFIDMVYFNEIKKDMIKSFKKKISREKLNKYLKKYNKKFANKALRLIS